MNADPLSARLTVLADDIAQIGRLIPDSMGNLRGRIAMLAVRAGLAAVAAQAEERDTHRLRRAMEEAHANAQDEAEAAEAVARANQVMDARHARARIIAEMLRPVQNGTAAPDAAA